jgi:hypothetical protein
MYNQRMAHGASASMMIPGSQMSNQNSFMTNY